MKKLCQRKPSKFTKGSYGLNVDLIFYFERTEKYKQFLNLV